MARVYYGYWPDGFVFEKFIGGFMRKLYIVRHGQTLFNLKGMTQGWCDSPLTDLGIRQAQKVGEYFKENNIKFDEAYSSTQERACDTLELITDLPYKRVKGLKEWNFGMMEGEAEILQIVPRRPGQMTHENFFVPWGGESDKEVAARMTKTIKEILEKSDANTILMVSHAGAMWTHVLSTLDNPQRNKPGHLGNCAILEYDVDDNNKLKFVTIHEPAKDVK